MQFQIEPQGYEYTTDPITGASYATRKSTGEIFPAVTMTVPFGTKAYTPEDQERWSEKKVAEAERHLKRKAEHFFFASLNDRFGSLSPESAARLMFLCTFLGYDSPILYKTERTPMYRRDLPEIMNLARSTVDKFLNEAAKYIRVDENGMIVVDDSIFYRRTVRGTAYDPHQRIYIERLRSLYRATPSGQHRKLGYIFQMLPFINVEFNILCHNPEETDVNRIEKMTLAEFCDLSGYKYRKLSRLRAEYSKIVFPVGDKPEQFCLFVYNGTDVDDAMIIVNPYIIYSGTHFEDVRILGSFFK